MATRPMTVFWESGVIRNSHGASPGRRKVHTDEAWMELQSPLSVAGAEVAVPTAHSFPQVKSAGRCFPYTTKASNQASLVDEK